MSASNSKYVVPDPDGGRDATAPSSQQVAAHASTQKEGKRQARESVGNPGDWKVVIHRLDGRVLNSEPVALGVEPYPRKDTRQK